MDKNKEVGKLLKNKRQQIGYSLEDVQYLLKTECNINLDISNISRYENGTVKNMNPKYIRGFCKIYKIDFIPLFKKLEFLNNDDFSADNRLGELNKRELGHYEEFMKQATLYFEDGRVPDEDKKKILEAMNEVYFIAKHKNKLKRQKIKED